MKRLAVIVVTSIWASGCTTIGPNYKRPPVTVPDTFRGQAAEPQPTASPASPGDEQQPNASLGDEKWWEVFQDEELQALVR